MSLRPLGKLPLRVSDALGVIERFVEHSMPCLSSSLKFPAKSHLRSRSETTWADETPAKTLHSSETPSKPSRRLVNKPAKSSRQSFRIPAKSSQTLPAKSSRQSFKIPAKSSQTLPTKSPHQSFTIPAKLPRRLAETPSLFDRVLSLRNTASPAEESPAEQYLLDHLRFPLAKATDRAVGQLVSRGDRTNASLNTIRQLFNGTRGNPSLRRNARHRTPSRPIEQTVVETPPQGGSHLFRLLVRCPHDSSPRKVDVSSPCHPET